MCLTDTWEYNIRVRSYIGRGCGVLCALSFQRWSNYGWRDSNTSGGGVRGAKWSRHSSKTYMPSLVCAIQIQYQRTQCSTLTRRLRWSYRTCKTRVVPHPPASSGPHLRPTKGSSYVHHLLYSPEFDAISESRGRAYAHACTSVFSCRYCLMDEAGVYSDVERHC